MASPTPSDGVGIGGVAGCIKTKAPKRDLAWHRMTAADKMEVARQRRTTALTIRPWHGPIPKKKKCPSEEAAPAPAIPISEIRSRRLNFLLGPVGLQTSEPVMGLADDGYVAHHEAQAGLDALPSIGADPMLQSDHAGTALSSPRASHRRNLPGFPRLGPGRAAHVRAPQVVTPAMAGRGNAQPSPKVPAGPGAYGG
ncbi:hypothetical protein ZWY2020_013168 [Hordeum vulgare]|nr:hypothetical protein ZWY2020_013168 [Hordeum vulgare]